VLTISIASLATINIFCIFGIGGRPPPPQQQPPMNNSKQALQSLLRARTTGPMGQNSTQFQQFQQNPNAQRQPNILHQQLRGQGPGQMQQQRFPGQGMNPNPMLYQQQQQQQQPQSQIQSQGTNFFLIIIN